jgi:glycosyltransferase involved in cell wall biosynthesis
MPKQKPDITVVTVVKNGAETIAKTIESVLMQQGIEIEYLILDGESTDGTISIVQSYGDKIDRFISEKDAGIYDAMNKGALLATGAYICYLNADDHFVDKHVLSRAIQIDGGVEAITTSVNYIMPHKTVKLQMEGSQYDTIPHPGFILKAEVMRNFPFDTQWKFAADIDLLIRLDGQVSLKKVDIITVNMISGGAGGGLESMNESIRIYWIHGIYKRWLVTSFRKWFYLLSGRFRK